MANQGLIDFFAQRRMLRETGRGMAPDVKDPRIRGLLESDDVAKVQAGIGLLSERRLTDLVGQKSQQPYQPGQGMAPLRDVPGSGLMGALQQNDPNAFRDFYAQLPALGGQFVKPGLEGLKSIQPNASESPSAVREFEFFEKLGREKGPEAQRQFLEIKRAFQPYQAIDYQGGRAAFDKRIGAVNPLSTAAQEAGGQAAVAGATGYGKKAGTDAAEVDVKQHEAAIAAGENINKIDTLLAHLKTSTAVTGMGAELFKNIERAKVLLSDSEKAGRKVSDTELLDTMMGSEVFPLIGALGVGARGLDTPAEREFLRQVMTGTIPMNKQTLTRMTEIRRDVTKRAIERFNKRVESGELNRYFELTGRPKEKITVGSPQAKRIRVDAQGNVIR